VRERFAETLTGIRGDLATLGSLATLYAVAPEATLTGQLLPLEIGLLAVAPEATLTGQLLPLEIGLLAGMALVYLGYGRSQP